MMVSGTAEANLASANALVARLKEAPRLADTDLAEQRLQDWLSGLVPELSAGVGALLTLPVARELLIGIVEFSPYLLDLVRAEPGG